MNKDMTDWHAGSRQLGICEGESSTGPCDITTCIHCFIKFREFIFTMTCIHATLIDLNNFFVFNFYSDCRLAFLSLN